MIESLKVKAQKSLQITKASVLSSDWKPIHCTWLQCLKTHHWISYLFYGEPKGWRTSSKFKCFSAVKWAETLKDWKFSAFSLYLLYYLPLKLVLMDKGRLLESSCCRMEWVPSRSWHRWQADACGLWRSATWYIVDGECLCLCLW
jgi:hypothetical protein